MGLNFYGRHIKDAQAQKLDHILGRDYINILKELERKRLYKPHIGYMIYLKVPLTVKYGFPSR